MRACLDLGGCKKEVRALTRQLALLPATRHWWSPLAVAALGAGNQAPTLAVSLIRGSDPSGCQRAALVQAALVAVGRAPSGSAWELTKLLQEDSGGGGGGSRAPDKNIHRPSLLEVRASMERSSSMLLDGTHVGIAVDKYCGIASVR